MRPVKWSLVLIFLLLGGLLICSSCKPPINVTGEEHFDKNGLSTDSVSSSLAEVCPKAIKFYVEVSGSMNGFFRSNKSTAFKSDVWSILSGFKSLSKDVYQLSSQCIPMSQDVFRTKMNQGDFISAASTHIPNMLRYVIENIDGKKGESAVLISDMKYDPVNDQDISVLLEQYQTDIRDLLSDSNLSFSLIAATSNYLDKSGQVISEKSPYYYLLIGEASNVIWLRNCINTLLGKNYAGSLDCGIDYCSLKFSLSNPDNLMQLEDEPTFTDFDRKYNDTCSFTLTLDLETYPWDFCNSDVIEELVQVKMKNGSGVKIDTIICHEDNHFNNELKRKATADIHLKVYDMYDDCDVVELNFLLPDNEMLINKITRPQFRNFWGATSTVDYDKSFSIENFVQGCFHGSKNVASNQPIRILISTINQ